MIIHKDSTCACKCVCVSVWQGRHGGFFQNGWSHRSAVSMATGLSGPLGVKPEEGWGVGGETGRERGRLAIRLGKRVGMMRNLCRNCAWKMRFHSNFKKIISRHERFDCLVQVFSDYFSLRVFF